MTEVEMNNKRKEEFLHSKKLSRLLEMALEDLKKVEKDPRYRVSMWCWHETLGDQCLVCLAGACLAETFKFRISVNVPALRAVNNEAAACRLLAIDCLRSGDVESAADRMGIGTKLKNRQMPTYDEPTWWDAMYKLVSDLKEAGE